MADTYSYPKSLTLHSKLSDDTDQVGPGLMLTVATAHWKLNFSCVPCPLRNVLDSDC